MIKNSKEFVSFSEAQRRKDLKHLTYRQSARLTEAMLSSVLLRKMNFKDDDHPIALFKQVQLKKKSR